jgi:hypothetical protein
MIYLQWREAGGELFKVEVTPFVFSVYFSVRKDNKMRVWLGTATPGQKGQTRGTASTRD